MFSSTDPAISDWSSYAYCGGDPVNYIDPYGEFPWIAAGLTLGGFLIGGTYQYWTGQENPQWSWGGAFIGGGVGLGVGIGMDPALQSQPINPTLQEQFDLMTPQEQMEYLADMTNLPNTISPAAAASAAPAAVATPVQGWTQVATQAASSGSSTIQNIARAALSEAPAIANMVYNLSQADNPVLRGIQPQVWQGLRTVYEQTHATYTISSGVGGDPHSPTSYHRVGRAIDISRVNDVHVAPGLDPVHEQAFITSGAREVYGPNVLYSVNRGRMLSAEYPALYRAHRLHIHVAW